MAILHLRQSSGSEGKENPPLRPHPGTTQLVGMTRPRYMLEKLNAIAMHLIIIKMVNVEDTLAADTENKTCSGAKGG